MKLHEPFEISSRLLPCVRLGGATIQLEYAGYHAGQRHRFRWTIDLPDGSEHCENGLYCSKSDLQGAFADLASFLSACGEAVLYRQRTGQDSDNELLFPQEVAEWAAMFTDELANLADELAGETKFIEE